MQGRSQGDGSNVLKTTSIVKFSMSHLIGEFTVSSEGEENTTILLIFRVFKPPSLATPLLACHKLVIENHSYFA